MTDQPSIPRRGRLPLTPIVLVLWVVVYLCMMGSSDWPWESKATGIHAVLNFGAVPPSTMTRFGSAVPGRMHDGEWTRAFTAGALNGSLLNLLLLAWFFSSMAKTLRPLAGIAALIAIMILGGAVGSGVHALVYPDTGYAAPGPFGWIGGLLGLQLGLGLFGKVPGGRRLVAGTVFTLVLIGALMWLTGGEKAWNSDTHRPALGLESLGGSFGAGLVLCVLLQPKRLVRGSAPWATGIAWLATGIWIFAAVTQAPRTVRASNDGPMRTFVSNLWTAEREARAIYDDARAASEGDKQRAQELVLALLPVPEHLDADDAAKLAAYVQAMLPIAKGQLVDPHARLLIVREAFAAWIESEQRLRRAYGMAPRPANRKRIWTRP